MKNHILCRYSETANKVKNPNTIYDFQSQVSYYDSIGTRKVIDAAKKFSQNATFETSTVETTDKDHYAKAPIGTVLTENVEHSDADGLLMFGNTIETRGTENSDQDNLWKMLSTITTFSTENTDMDN